MLELQQKYPELQTFENRSQNIYSQSLNNQRQRKINANSTQYSFSFSNFKILHILIKSFVIPTTNRVYGVLKNHFLKSNLKNLKNSNNLKNLKLDQLQTIQIQRIRRKVKDTKYTPLLIRANSCFPKKVALNPV